MAAKTVLNYLDRDSVVHKMTGTTKAGIFPVVHVRKYDHIQHMGVARAVRSKSCCIQTQQD